MSAMTPAPFDTRLDEEARGLVEQAAGVGVTVRLMGGMGIRLLLADRYPAQLTRRYGDLDVLVRRREARALEDVIAGRGWEPAAEFNALNGARRMLFHDPASDAQVDVFVEAFEMCHRLPLAEGLEAAGPLTLQACDLLMSKLQIVQLNAKDRNDCYAVLIGCSGAPEAHQAVDVARVARVAAEDWGTHHTFERNLVVLEEHVGDVGLAPADAALVRQAVGDLRMAMDAAPKSRSWKLRARIGERKRWYDEPEEVDREGAA